MELPTKESVLIKILEEANEYLNTNKIIYWLDCGTLLGAVRDKGLIQWDSDIDIGCWKTDGDYRLKQNIKKHFEAQGYNVYLTDYYINIHNPNYPQYNFDINFYSIKGDKAITPSSSLSPYLKDPLSITINHLIRFIYNNRLYVKNYSPSVKHIIKIAYSAIRTIFLILPSSWQDSFLKILIYIRLNLTNHKAEVVKRYIFDDLLLYKVFNGVYPIPKKYQEYLASRYGLSWKTPIQKWDTAKQDNTVKHISGL